MKELLRKFLVFSYSLEQKLFGRFGLGRIGLLRRLKSFFFARLQPEFAETNGLKIYLDRERGFLDPGDYKKRVVELLLHELTSGQTALDVGANIGYFTCLMARAVGVGGRIYAFEPDPSNLILLRKNLTVNNLRNVIVVPLAVCERHKREMLFMSGAHSAVGFRSVPGSARGLEVESVSLDEYFGARIPKIDLIKMDIIGSEAKALRGMKNFLKVNRHTKIISAFCPAFLRGAGSDPKEYLQELTRLGFKIYEITQYYGPREIPPDSFPEFMRRHDPNRKVAQTELYCVR